MYFETCLQLTRENYKSEGDILIVHGYFVFDVPNHPSGS